MLAKRTCSTKGIQASWRDLASIAQAWSCQPSVSGVLSKHPQYQCPPSDTFPLDPLARHRSSEASFFRDFTHFIGWNKQDPFHAGFSGAFKAQSLGKQAGQQLQTVFLAALRGLAVDKGIRAVIFPSSASGHLKGMFLCMAVRVWSHQVLSSWDLGNSRT
uniref:Uncharacterized protein n=1 Tax=Sphaerodactylus townsendi TaxID=933632 RepID=A0ACB8FQL9_9SAUR